MERNAIQRDEERESVCFDTFVDISSLVTSFWSGCDKKIACRHTEHSKCMVENESSVAIVLKKIELLGGCSYFAQLYCSQ